MFRNLSVNHLVALLAFVLALASFLVLRRYHFPDKVCVGGAILSILAVGIFWSCVLLGTDDDEEE
ncbi:MAG: hypothetical protein LCH63_00155 [Candidatus Melainabacteria bacterium]|jgi:hypothetical protein|uniref:Uncharacterized protein n=1 Tax=Candidatus Obscuribacter phosphatis TaxID=1906157 RepID=A0A8J7TNB1_9BACT|nr:hypothetical protein [Candidatus Obscuribacter phosphatis]MCA0312230.1 hypothetical protein [Candidatus Melainabacteria bacterium]OPZ91353.1 MAG: hypothetical protein BWY75_00352 [bacterium ADurb.Bin425]